MKPRTGKAVVVVLAAFVGAAALVGGATKSASARADSTEQRIYLDPETGEVLDQPPAGRSAGQIDRPDGQTGDTGLKQRRLPAGPRAWTNEEGAEMLTPNRDAAPSTRAVRCPDGTLRMGHADRATANENVVEALCQQSSD